MLQKTKMTFLRLFAIIGFVVLFAIASISLASCSSDDSSSTTLQINSNGELVVTYSDGTTENLGTVVGSDGADGATGATGATGETGSTGATGNGISKMEYDEENNQVVITYTDGSTTTLPWVASSSSSGSTTDECSHEKYVKLSSVSMTTTCGEQNAYLAYCTNCNDVIVVWETLEHDYSVENKVAVTCTTDGYTYYTCSNCGEKRTNDDGTLYTTNVVTATGHDYEAVVTAVTCLKDGYTTYTCKNCGDSYIDDVVTAKGSHTLNEKYAQYDWEDSTGCEHGGVLHYQCDVCGQAVTEIIEPGDHVIALVSDGQGGYSNLVKPTADSEGSITGKCLICEKENAEVVLSALYSYNTDYTYIEGSYVSGSDSGTDSRTDTYMYTYRDGLDSTVTLAFSDTNYYAHKLSNTEIKTATTTTTAASLDDTFKTTYSYVGGYHAVPYTYQDLIDDGLLALSSGQTATCYENGSGQTAYKYEYTCEVCGETHYLYLTTPHTYAYAVQTTNGGVSYVAALGAHSYVQGANDTYKAGTSSTYSYVKYCTVCGSETVKTTDDITDDMLSTSTTAYVEATCEDAGSNYRMVTFADKTTEVLTLATTDVVTVSATGHMVNGINIPKSAVIHVTTGYDGNALAYYVYNNETTVIYGQLDANSKATDNTTGTTVKLTVNGTPCATGSSGTANFYCETCGGTATYTGTTDHTLVEYKTNLASGDVYYDDTNGTATTTTTASAEIAYYQAAVCVHDGYQLMQCSVCGEIHMVLVEHTVTAHSYTYTLKDNETILGTCSVCGDTTEITVTSSMLSSEVTTAANCTNTGIKTWTVTYNNTTVGTYTETIATTGHYLNGVEIVEYLSDGETPLYYYIGENEHGYYAYYYTNNDNNNAPVYVYGASDSASQTVLDSSILIYTDENKVSWINNKGTLTQITGDYRDYIITASASETITCATSGTGIFTCSHSVHGVVSASVEIKVYAGHDWDDGTTTAATSYTEGYITYTCNECGITSIEYIEPLGFDTDNATVTASGTSADAATVTIVVNGKGTAYTDVLTIVITKSAVTATLTRDGSAVTLANYGIVVTSKNYCVYSTKDATCSEANQYIYDYDYTITITGTGSAVSYACGTASGEKINYGSVNASGHTWKGVESSYYRTASSDGMTYLYVVDYCTTCEKYNIKSQTLVTITEGTNGALEATIGASSSYPSYYIVKLDITEAGFYSVTLDGEGKENVYVKISGYDESYTNYYYADLNYETSGWGPYAAVTQTGEYTSYIFDYYTDYPAEFTKDGASLYVYIYTFDETVEASEFSVTLTKLTDFDLDAYIDAQIAAQYDYVLTTSGLVADLASDGTWYGAEYTFYVNEAGTYTIAVSGDSSSEIDYDDGYNAESLWAGDSTTYTFAVGDTFSLWCPYDATVTITAAGGTTPSTPTAQPVSYSIVFDDYGYTSKQTFEEAGTYYLTTTGYNTTGSTDDVVIYYTTTKTNDSINYSSSDYLTVGNVSYYSCLQFNGSSGTSDRVLTIDLSDYAGYSVTITLQMTAAQTTTVATLSDSSNSLATSGDTTGEGITKYSSIPLTYTGTVTSDGIYTLMASQSLRVYSISIELTPAA